MTTNLQDYPLQGEPGDTEEYAPTVTLTWPGSKTTAEAQSYLMTKGFIAVELHRAEHAKLLEQIKAIKEVHDMALDAGRVEIATLRHDYDALHGAITECFERLGTHRFELPERAMDALDILERRGLMEVGTARKNLELAEELDEQRQTAVSATLAFGEANARAVTAEKTVANLRAINNEQEARIASMEAVEVGLRAEIERLKAEVEVSEKTIAYWVRLHFDASGKNGHLTAEIERLKGEVEAITNDFDAHGIPSQGEERGPLTLYGRFNLYVKPLFLNADLADEQIAKLEAEIRRLRADYTDQVRARNKQVDEIARLTAAAAKVRETVEEWKRVADQDPRMGMADKSAAYGRVLALLEDPK